MCLKIHVFFYLQVLVYLWICAADNARCATKKQTKFQSTAVLYDYMPKCQIFFCHLSFSLISVSLQEMSSVLPVSAVIGGSAILPCLSSKDDLEIKDIDVHWRHNDSLKVYDIIGGETLTEHPYLSYENRTESFPEQYVKGRFHLKITNLTYSDAGEYTCFILHSSKSVTVRLLINGLLTFKLHYSFYLKPEFRKKKFKFYLCIYNRTLL